MKGSTATTISPIWAHVSSICVLLAWVGLLPAVAFGSARSQIESLPGATSDKTQAADGALPLASGWEYFWGDPPGLPVAAMAGWADAASATSWPAFDVRQPPPGRGDHTVVWFRVRLPATLAAGTTLLIPGAYQLFQVIAGGSNLYNWGDFTESGAARFLGGAFHLVPLPPALAGKELYLRIYSDFKNIGITGPMLIGSPAQLISYIVRKDMHRVVLGCLFMFIGIFQLFLFRRRAHVAEYLAFGAFAFLYGLHGVARTQLRDLLVYAPLAWKYVEVLTIFILPIGLLVFIERVFGSSYRQLMRRLCQLNVAVVAVSIPLSLYDAGLLERALSAFHYLFMPGCAALIAGAVWQAWKGDRNAAIFAAGLAAMAVPAAVDGLVVGGSLPWIDPISSWGVLVFLFALQVILSRKLAEERREKFILEREIETAAILSSTFLPAPLFEHPRYKIEVVFRPAARLGGDWFAYYLYHERYLHVHIGDVTGHGPASALTAAFAKGATDMLYNKLAIDGSPEVPLEQLHQNLNQLLGGATRSLMTLFSIAIDLTTGRMEYINSGHMVQFVCSPSSMASAILTGHGRSLLGFGGRPPLTKPDRIALRGDEVIFMFSDGLVEALGRNDGRGVKALYNLLKASVRDNVGGLREQILALLDKGAGQVSGKEGDDITFIMVRMNLHGEGGTAAVPLAKVISLTET